MTEIQNIPGIKNKKKRKLILSYTGSFDSLTRIKLGQIITEKTRDNPNSGRKVFKIFMELALNIYYYSGDRFNNDNDSGSSGTGTIHIYEESESYVIMTENKINAENIAHVTEKIAKINSLDRNGLRELKRDMTRLPRNTYGGSNIGLIYVALISAHPIEHKVIKIKKNYYSFNIIVKIKK
ncbi:MAG: hypothetical protein HY738_07660 [Bacteroidia bacterium]|nr:hypothetical protein [Bacteroidia bacterium]